MKALLYSPDLKGYSKLFRSLGKDERLFPTHVSLFSGLFIFWQRSGYQRPFKISRSGLMATSRIASTATYQKCIKELRDFGYILYLPSFHPTKASMVDWPENWKVNDTASHVGNNITL